jgi:hypothetical protein
MTTIPSRIDHIRPAIESALSQTVPVDHVELNIPHFCVRMGRPYHIPGWLEGMKGVKIFAPPDYGPITKVGPTFLRYRGDRETYIWSIDDDCAYPNNQLALLCLAHDPSKYRILCRHGGILRPDGIVQYLWGEIDVNLFEGFGSVLYPPNCIGADFSEFLRATSANAECRKNDDVVLSLYFRKHDVPIHLYNVPSDTHPWMHEGWLPHSKIDAASSAAGFHAANRNIIAFIGALWKN